MMMLKGTRPAYSLVRVLPTTWSQNCLFVTSSKLQRFHEPLKEDLGILPETEYITLKNFPTAVKEGFKILKREIKVAKEELREHFLNDPVISYKPGDNEIIWKFDNHDALVPFQITTDKQLNYGNSEASFTLSKSKKGLFSGYLNLVIPKDGSVVRTGYCNMRSPRKMKSFLRDDYYDFSIYTHLMLRVRGDGRPYMVNLSTAGYFDLMWYDIYHYVLYTRGGPYWQLTMIPFSKFFLGSKGRTQDRQCSIPLHRISHFGITCADRSHGPFNLEIDYVGLYYDPSHKEDFAYEMYETPVNIVGSS